MACVIDSTNSRLSVINAALGRLLDDRKPPIHAALDSIKARCAETSRLVAAIEAKRRRVVESPSPAFASLKAAIDALPDGGTQRIGWSTP